METEARIMSAAAGVLILGTTRRYHTSGNRVDCTDTLILVNLNPHHLLVERLILRGRGEKAAQSPAMRYILNLLIGPGEEVTVFNRELFGRVRDQTQAMDAEEPFTSRLESPGRLEGPPPEVKFVLRMPHGTEEIEVPALQLGSDGANHLLIHVPPPV